MTSQRVLSIVLVLLAAAAACGSDGPDSGKADPRCAAACTPPVPTITGAGAVCTTASQSSCLAECEARIAGVTTTCATCLVEDACLLTDAGSDAACGSDSGPGTECQANNVCTTYGPLGSCDFPANDEAAFEACRRQIDPRHDVSCTAKFRPSTECASLCPS